MNLARKTVVALIAISTAAMPAATVCGASPDLETINIGKPVRIEVFPAEIKLTSARQQAQLVVTGHYADGTLQDLTRVTVFKSSDEKVVAVDNTVVHPMGDGSAQVTAQVGGQKAVASVSVSGQSEPDPVSFNYGTLVALSKQGCNAGACHGSPSGKGGFRMSLRAFDAELDKLTLVREEFGRRTNPLNPDASLLLKKPMMEVPHGGGKKLSKNDAAYDVLRTWIAEGCRLDPADAPKCVRVEVYPPSGRVLKRPAHTQQLSVRAYFSDGTVRDVTPLAVYTSSDEQVASVTKGGMAVGNDRGEIAVVVRYLEFIETTFITFVRDIDGFAWNDPPANNYIDKAVHDKLKQLKFLPSDLCTDDEFVRRVFLDVIGILPTIDETQKFVADKAEDKRAKLVDALLERPEFAKFWTLKWGDILRMTTAQVGAGAVHKYHRWVQRAFEKNMPYDQFARELLTAKGSTLNNPAANFYRTASDTNESVETISQIFLGARLQCAKCHNHPFERWTQDNYYGMAAFFNRVQRKKTGRPDEVFVYFGRSGEVIQPRTGKQMKPWLPLTGEIDPPAESDRREIFVDWLVKPDNPFFAKVEANRIWSYLLGRGIVEPADDFRDSNPPSNAALLAALAKDFADSGFDRKHLIRTILNSHTYQASSRTNKFNADDSKYFSHYQPRMLGAEQLLDAICHVSAVPESFAGLPSGTKATQLPSPDMAKSDFLKIFGQPERQTVCACERSTESNLGQALQLYNGPLVHGKLRAGNNRFRQLAASKKSDNEIITQLYLAAFSREPGEKELAAANRHIAAKPAEFGAHIEQLKKQLEGMPKQKPDEKLDDATTKAIAELKKKIADLTKQHADPEFLRMQAFEDICWVIINMNEFLFQH